MGTNGIPEDLGRRGPLTGMRVLELGSFIAGPFAGQLLGDYGADVIKIEPPAIGDPMRRWGLMKDGSGLWWPTIARNKRSVAVDLRSPEGREIVRRLAGQCDIVVENFRPGRLQEWGLGYEVLAAANPKLVMVHVSGYGQTGPRAAQAGFGSIGEAYGGIRHTTGAADGASSRTGISLGDALAAMFAVIGSLAAITNMQRTGIGQEVDVALYEAVFALMESSLADYEIAGVARTRSGGVLPGVAPSNSYATRDDASVVIAGNADSVFARLCQTMETPELAADPRFSSHAARGQRMVELDALIEAWTCQHDADEILELLERSGVPAGRVYTIADIVTDQHYLARGMIQRWQTDSGLEFPTTGVVPQFSRTPGVITALGPRLGEHSRDVLVGLNIISEPDFAGLEERGVVAGEHREGDRALT